MQKKVLLFLVITIAFLVIVFSWIRSKMNKTGFDSAPVSGVSFAKLNIKSQSGKTVQFSIPQHAYEWAIKNYGKEPRKLSAILQSMESIEYMIRFPNAKENNRKMSWKSLDCMAQVFGVDMLDQIHRELLSEMLTTKERIKGYDDAQVSLSGSLERAPTYDKKDEICEFSEVLPSSSSSSNPH